MIEVTAVEVIRNRTVRLSFSDGSERVVDLTPFLWGPAFEAVVSDDEAFNEIRVDPAIGTIVWPNGADLAPEVLHGGFEPASLSAVKEVQDVVREYTGDRSLVDELIEERRQEEADDSAGS